MIRLSVCGLSELGMRPSAPHRCLSLLDPEWDGALAAPVSAAASRSVLRFHDIIAPEPARSLPQANHIAAIIAFADEVMALASAAEDRDVLVHCQAGLSRSPAAMLLVLARLEPEADPDALFARLRTLRPSAWPNSLMIRLGDEQLDRGGALIEALRDHYGRQVRSRPDYIRQITALGRVAELEMAR